MAGGAAPCAAATTGAPMSTAAVATTFFGVTNAVRRRSMCLLNACPVPGRRLVGFARAGADVVALFDRENEDTAVADFSGSSRRHDRFDHILDDRVGHDDFDLDLGQETDAV